MSRTNRKGSGQRPSRHVSVRAVRRTAPDNKQLSRALITFALQQAAEEAAAEAQQAKKKPEQPHD